MTEDRSLPGRRGSRLQEAIDTIVQTFDYPSELTIQYTVTDGKKRTTFEVESPDGGTTFELHYDGRDTEVEPELTRLD